MKKLIFIVMLLLATNAAATPNTGMVGQKIPQGFYEYVPFWQQETRCKAIKQNLHINLMVRHYTHEGTIFRSDLFLGFVIIGHYLPFQKEFYRVDTEGTVTGVVEYPSFGPVQHCGEGFVYYLEGLK